MELEEMKLLWGEMSAEMEKQKQLTGSLIISMTKMNYRHKLNKIIIPEVSGALLCFAAIVFILVNFHKLDTGYMQACAIISAAILFIQPVVSVRAVYQISSINISANSYKQTLSDYAKGKIQFVFAQKLSFYLGAVLLLTILPVAVELMGGKDPFKKDTTWFVYIIAYPLVYGLARWTFKKYMQTTADAENMLKEIAESVNV
jgi:hypothetical protein